LVLGWKEINGISWFGSLPQGERRIERISPSPLPSPAGWRGEKEDEKILTMCPHPDPLPRWGEGRKKMKRFKQCALTLALSRGGEREKERRIF
jgi:hypothetical protein